MTPEELKLIYPYAKSFSVDENGNLIAVDETPVEEIQHKEWGEFAGSKLLRLNGDFKKYDIAHYPTYFCKESEKAENYLKETQFGKDSYTEAQHEALYFAVSSMCEADGNYVIDCWQGRYTVRLRSIIKRYHYQTMTDKEKAEYKFNFLSGKISENFSKCKSYLTESDYLVQKLNEAANLDDEEEVARLKTEHAKVYEQRKLARKAVNKLQEIKDMLGIQEDLGTDPEHKVELTKSQLKLVKSIEV